MVNNTFYEMNLEITVSINNYYCSCLRKGTDDHEIVRYQYFRPNKPLKRQQKDRYIYRIYS